MEPPVGLALDLSATFFNSFAKLKDCEDLLMKNIAIVFER